MEPVAIGVVGAGHIGSPHAAKYAAEPGVRLVAVADLGAGRVTRVARLHGARELIGLVDAVSVAVPTTAHHEVARLCRGTGKLLINEPALDRLQSLRDRLGEPLIVRSAYRSPEHNRAVGGATRSKHLDGAAFDIAMANHDLVALEGEAPPNAREAVFLGYGFYPRSGFIHVDPGRQWGERFSVRETAFTLEAQLAREVLADSRTMKSGDAVGVTTMGAAGVELAQSVLAETQTAILPLVPYLDTLR